MRLLKTIHTIIDGVLLLFLIVLSYITLSLTISKNTNYGVSSLFGKSMLYIASDSMDDEANSHMLSFGVGIVIEKVDIEELKISTPIYNDQDEIIDYQKDGDVITFYDHRINAPNTHRLVEKYYQEDEGKYYFITMGDNPIIHQAFLKELWNEDQYIGKVVSSSRTLGQFFEISSPEAAAYLSNRTGSLHLAWLFPLLTIIPVFLFGVNHLVMTYSKNKEQKDEKC